MILYAGRSHPLQQGISGGIYWECDRVAADANEAICLLEWCGAWLMPSASSGIIATDLQPDAESDARCDAGPWRSGGSPRVGATGLCLVPVQSHVADALCLLKCPTGDHRTRPQVGHIRAGGLGR
jgi:hypothetical protein